MHTGSTCVNRVHYLKKKREKKFIHFNFSFSFHSNELLYKINNQLLNNLILLRDDFPSLILFNHLAVNGSNPVWKVTRLIIDQD